VSSRTTPDGAEAAPARHRLAMEDLEPAASAEVVVVSFDDEPAESDTVDPSGDPGRGGGREPAGAVVADFGALAAVAAPRSGGEVAGARRGAHTGATPPKGSHTGDGAEDEIEDRGPAFVDLDELEAAPDGQPPAELGSLAEPAGESPQLTLEDLRFGRGSRAGGARRGRRADGARPGDRAGAGGVGSGPPVTSRGRRGAAAPRSERLPDDAPALDTAAAAWEAGEFTSIGADPERADRTADRTSDRISGRASGRGRGRARRSAPEEPAEDPRTPEELEVAAKEICLRLLTDRARTKHELGARLRRKGIPDEVAEGVLARFDEVGLIDDEAFAGAWVRSRHNHRGLGRRAIAQELRRKGVAREIADEALTEVDDEAEAQRARELVERKLRTVTLDGPDDRRKVAQRLVGMLARKGYPPGIAYGAVRTALAAHGAEEDELGPPDLD